MSANTPAPVTHHLGRNDMTKLEQTKSRAKALAREKTALLRAVVEDRRPAPESAKNSDALALAELIETRLLGVPPGDQDLELEDHDWGLILSALRATDAAALKSPVGDSRCAKGASHD